MIKRQLTQSVNYLVLIFILLVFSQACRTTEETEAHQELDKLLNSMLTECDDLYSGKNGTFTIQFKNPALNLVKTDSLSEADKLNGVEWKGLAQFSCSSYRLITSDGIGKWQDCPTQLRTESQDNYLFFSSVGTDVVIGKVKGKWIIQSKHQVSPSDCTNTVPKLS